MTSKTANFPDHHAQKIEALAEQYGVTFNEMVKHLTTLGQIVFARLPELDQIEAGDVSLISFNEAEMKFWKRPVSKWGGKRK